MEDEGLPTLAGTLWSGYGAVMSSLGADKQASARSEQLQQCFEREVARLMDRLYGTALRLSRNPDEAEDIVAEAVGKAWRKLDELRDPDSIEGWLFRILNNTFISTWRKRQCRQAREVDVDTTDPEACNEMDFSLFGQLHQPFLLWWGTPEEEFLNGILKEDIQQALDSLPDTFRVVVVLVEMQGCTYEETAELLEIPLGTVRSRLNRARGLLQKKLWEQARDAGFRSCRGGSHQSCNHGEDR